jgi:hypothetical protein
MADKKYGLQARGKDWIKHSKNGNIVVLVYDTKEEAQLHADHLNNRNKKYQFKIPIVVEEYRND